MHPKRDGKAIKPFRTKRQRWIHGISWTGLAPVRTLYVEWTEGDLACLQNGGNQERISFIAVVLFYVFCII